MSDEGQRCIRCDRACVPDEGLCWGPMARDCVAVDWRARALAAEARVVVLEAEVERAPYASLRQKDSRVEQLKAAAARAVDALALGDADAYALAPETADKLNGARCGLQNALGGK